MRGKSSALKSDFWLFLHPLPLPAEVLVGSDGREMEKLKTEIQVFLY